MICAVAIAAIVQLSATSVPRGYVCLRAPSPITIDGNVDKPAWRNAPWTELFVDIEGSKKPMPRFQTRAKMLWDEQNLYIGAKLEEPQLQASLTEHDSVIFQDNDFEIFIDPDGDNQLYSEFEMNALNTTWDLLLVRPYRAGGPPVDGFELKGLRSAVHLAGSLNDGSDTDKGWSVEVAIPWHALEQIAGCPCPPKEGDQWRINFSRVEWRFHWQDGHYTKPAGEREDNWVWSPQGVVDMHRPEHWGVVQFSSASTGPVAMELTPGLKEKFVLCRLWDAEDAYREKSGHWGTLSQIGFAEPGVRLYMTPDLFEGAYKDYRIDQSLRFWKVGN